MAYVLSSVSGNLISAASAGYAPTNSADVSAIASAYASGKQDTLSFSYDDGKISAINGSALAGGGLVTSVQTALDPWYQTSISGLNGSSIYPKWAASADEAHYAVSAASATRAASAAAAPTAWASSFISSVSSPSGTIRVLNNNEIEGTNSAVLPSTVVEGFSVVSSVPQSLTAFSFTVPISNPNTQVIITGGWANGNFGISGDNGVTAESSLAGYVDVTFDMPGATAFDVTSEAWVGGIGYTASALASEVGGGIGELAWASALPTYQYDSGDKISAINGSALAGGGGGEADWSAESGQPGYIENKPVPKMLVAGQGITITENSTGLVVASTNTLYTAGSGLTLNGTTFSVDTAVVQGKITYDYDASGNISGIDGSSLAGSDPEATDLYVQSPLYTGVSGGSAYIGSHINQTVLWTGTGTTTGGTITLSESLANFERYGMYYYIPYQESGQTYYQEMVYKSGQTTFGIKTDGINSTLWRQYMDYGTMNETSISIVSGRQGGFWLTGTDRAFSLYDGNDRHHYFTKVVGINRIAGE